MGLRPFTMATLSFASAVRFGGTNRTERHYLDYQIDGQSIRRLLPVTTAEMISPFGWMENRLYDRDHIEQLTLVRPSHLKTGRVCLYVCPECGDIDCGALTVDIVDSGDQLIWRLFANETGYQGIMEHYPNVQPITFNKADYMRTFMRLHQGLY